MKYRLVSGRVAPTLIFFGSGERSHENNGSLFTRRSSGETGMKFINFNAANDSVNNLTYEYFFNGGVFAMQPWILMETEILIAWPGVIFQNRRRVGKADASFGTVLLGDGGGGF